MQYTESEVTEFITDNDVKFIKWRSAIFSADRRSSPFSRAFWLLAFEGGLPIDASRIMGFEKEADSELFLVPDTSTMSLLPWAARTRARRALFLRHSSFGWHRF